MALKIATYVCAGCQEETEGVWPAPDEQDEVPPAEQTCQRGHVQAVAYPGYSFFTEAG